VRKETPPPDIDPSKADTEINKNDFKTTYDCPQVPQATKVLLLMYEF
jgi:hypothetical protein